jgi:hypothetical protein
MAEPQENSKPVAERDIVGFDTSGDAPATAEKPQRISIAPVENKVMLDEPVRGKTTVMDPVVDVPTTETKTLQEPAAKDIQAQQTGAAWEDVLAGKVAQVGDIKINNRVLEFVNSNPKAMLALRSAWARSSQPQVPGEDVIIPFVREGEVVAKQVVQDPMMIPAAERYAQNRVNLDNLVSQYVPDAAVRQILVNRFETGDFYNSLETRLAEAGQSIITGIPMVGIMGYNAAGAYVDSKQKGTDFSTEWGARGNDIQNALNSTYKAIDTIFGLTGEGTLNPTMKMAFNKDIHNEFKRQLDANEITEDQYNARAMIEVDGELKPKEFITEEAAANLIDLAFNELPRSEQFGVMFLENVVGMAGPGALRSERTLRKLENMKNSSKYAKILEDVDDPFEAAQIINQAEGRTKINLNALSIGISQQRTTQAMGRLDDDLRSTDLEMDSLIRKGAATNSAAYKVLEGKRQNLINRKMQSMYTLKAYPYLKQNVEDALILSAGQLAGREYLSSAYDMDPASAEAIGLLGTMTVIAPAARFIGGQASKFLSSPRGGVGSNVSAVADFMTFGKYKGFNITDNTLKEYEAATGIKLTAEQRKAINYSIYLVNNTSSPAAREKILKAVDDYVELQDRIVSRFPEEAREKATELFTMSFAQSSNLGPLAALHAMSINKIDAKKLKNMDATYMVELMEQADAQVRATELALDNFQEFVRVTDGIADRESIQAMLDNTRNATTKFKDDLNRRSESTLEILGDIRKQVLSDPTIDVPEGFLENLVEADVALKKRLGKIVDERKTIGEVVTDIYAGVTDRVTSLKSRRGKGRGYIAGLSRAMEDALDAHLESMSAKGKAAYNAVREAAKTAPPIDMHDAVVDLMSKAGETDMARFFSPGGQFFAGRMGRIGYKTFDDMVKRTIPAETMGEIRQTLVANGFGQELVENMSDLEIALEMQRISPSFRPFAQANAYEVDEMRRFFRDYAYGVRESKPELGREVQMFAANMDTLIRTQDGETFSLLTKARETYRSEIGDRLRRGSTVRKLEDGRQGPEKMQVDANSMTRYRYLNEQSSPFGYIRPLTSKITGALNNKPADQADIRSMIDNLATDWGDRVDGQTVFNLDTEEGKAKFAAIQNLVNEQIYADWTERAIAVFEKTDGPASVLEGGYSFKNLADEGLMNDLTTVTVRQNGMNVEVPLVNLGDMYSEARDISRIIRENKAVRKRYKEFADDFANVESQVRRNADNNIKMDADSLNALQRFTGDITPDQFYDQFILNGSETKFDTLRDTFIPAVVKTGKSADEAEVMFDRAVSGLVSKAFMNRGGLAPSQGMRMTALDGGKMKVRQFTTPEVMLADVQEHREMLEMMLGEDHVSYLTDIADFLDRAATSQARSVEGVVKGYSVNEGLSRLYNISRGMVSPLYVTSEFAVRMAAQSGIEVLQLAAGNKEAARIINNMFKYPELVTRTDVDNLNGLLVEFATTELARMGQRELPTLIGDENEANTEGQ